MLGAMVFLKSRAGASHTTERGTYLAADTGRRSRYRLRLGIEITMVGDTGSPPTRRRCGSSPCCSRATGSSRIHEVACAASTCWPAFRDTPSGTAIWVRTEPSRRTSGERSLRAWSYHPNATIGDLVMDQIAAVTTTSQPREAAAQARRVGSVVPLTSEEARPSRDGPSGQTALVMDSVSAGAPIRARSRPGSKGRSSTPRAHRRT